MSEALNFQSIMMALQDFWAGKGCLIWQPYYTQVGAGTMNPGTYLRALGPEPWNVAYVEPSIRPDDARYGENPNRMQMHYQYQVILKPDPGNPQDLYLKSLEALGINPACHDIRFVEDNWEQPALGAWGLGWEVWLDGQEITQFTYFQQAGGINLDPVSVELTYGLERIAIALQRVSGFTEINWNDALTDGDVNLTAEQEHSRYYFETADIDRLRKMHTLFDAEAEDCLDQGLVLPAYDYILKCSHTFNILDTRGAVGVTERQAMFGRMRQLSRRVSEAYLAQREQMGYPWLDRVKPVTVVKPVAEEPAQGQEYPQEPAPFLMEIGTEELPASDLSDALQQLEDSLPGWLENLRLQHGEVQVLGTPRRLVVYIEELAPRQPDLEQLVKGPPAERAYSQDGTPTKAAIGFARGKGLPVEELQVMEMDGGRYAAAKVKLAGLGAHEVLGEALPEWVRSLRFEKSMRWNSSNVAFSRPIRWLLALHGRAVIDFEYAGLKSGRVTRGLRFNKPAEFALENTGQYYEYLSEQGILIDPAERKRIILEQCQTLAEEVGAELEMDEALLEEVTNLVEAPHALRGTFDRSHLSLPRPVLTSVMKKHQRYFPLFETDGKGELGLAPFFIAVRNGDVMGIEEVVDGNEHVIRARFADADFFVREDLKRPLEAYLPKLETMTFQVELGSMLEKTGRITSLVSDLAAQIELEKEQLTTTKRAAQLCKADLATSMVVEMTSLQGYMGSYYAEKSGETPQVSQAIFEHYLPRYAGDQIPGTKAGLVVGLADRLDSLVGLFAAGLAPTGNKDPFALRRAALGMVQNLIEWELDFDLETALVKSAAYQPIEVSEDSWNQVMEFIIGRLRSLLLDGGGKFDVVEAVLAEQGCNPARANQAVKELAVWVERGDWDQILPAYSRCVRITRDLDERYPFNPELVMEEEERGLYQALQEAEKSPRQTGSVDDFLNTFIPMIPAINLFFDEVLVMVEQEDIRQNRLGLLQRVAALADEAADMSKLEGF